MQGLTVHALATASNDAWQLLRTIRDDGPNAVWIEATGAAQDVLVLFDDAFESAVRVRDEAIYEIRADGRSRRMPDAEITQGDPETPESGSPSGPRTVLGQVRLRYAAQHAFVGHLRSMTRIGCAHETPGPHRSPATATAKV